MTKEEAKEYIYDCLDRSEATEIIEAFEQQSCEDAINREEALKHTHIEYDDDGIGHRVVYAEDIEELPSVTPLIKEWLSSFNADSATECFIAVQELKRRLH